MATSTVTVIIRIPTPLRSLCAGQPQVEVTVTVTVTGSTVGDALAALESRHAGFREKIQDAEGRVRRFVNVFVNSDDIRDRGGLETPVTDRDVITIVPAIAGGLDVDASSEVRAGAAEVAEVSA